MAPSPRHARLAVLCLVCAAGEAAATEHEFGGYHISVSAEPAGVTDYQITVANDELLLTRLTAAFEGTLSRSFVADLDRNGSFEVIVTYSHDGGRATELDIYSWKEYLLEPVKVGELDAAQRQGYQGGDEFALRDGQLVRVFQVHEQVEGGWTPTAARRELRYAFPAAKWVD